MITAIPQQPPLEHPTIALMHLTAVDPGRESGLAQFVGGRLVHATTVRAPCTTQCQRFVIERPQIYPDRRANPNDLITLAINVGRWEQCHAGVEIIEYQPRQWKAMLPKNVHHARFEKVLFDDERRIFATLDHNGRDAVGLGLFALGRIGLGGQTR